MEETLFVASGHNNLLLSAIKCTTLLKKITELEEKENIAQKKYDDTDDRDDNNNNNKGSKNNKEIVID